MPTVLLDISFIAGAESAFQAYGQSVRQTLAYRNSKKRKRSRHLYHLEMREAGNVKNASVPPSLLKNSEETKFFVLINIDNRLHQSDIGIIKVAK